MSSAYCITQEGKKKKTKYIQKHKEGSRLSPPIFSDWKALVRAGFDILQIPGASGLHLNKENKRNYLPVGNGSFQTKSKNETEKSHTLNYQDQSPQQILHLVLKM